jgi:hypothetical protein
MRFAPGKKGLVYLNAAEGKSEQAGSTRPARTRSDAPSAACGGNDIAFTGLTNTALHSGCDEATAVCL